MRTIVLIQTLFGLLAVTTVCIGGESQQIGVEERLGERIPLENLSFVDEDGQTIALKDLFDRPVVLTLVYFRCPGICTPLLNELAKVADNCDLMPGEDYRLVTISFDPKDTSEMAKPKQANMLAQMKKKQVPADGWRFLTGDAENIRRITEAVGFRYVPDKNNADFVHAATVIFLSPDGMIARYLTGTQFNPADLKLAVIDASEGRARSFMQQIQRLCYAYDPEGHAYVLKINRLILAVTLVFAATFGGFLVLRRGRKPRVKSPQYGTRNVEGQRRGEGATRRRGDECQMLRVSASPRPRVWSPPSAFRFPLSAFDSRLSTLNSRPRSVS